MFSVHRRCEHGLAQSLWLCAATEKKGGITVRMHQNPAVYTNRLDEKAKKKNNNFPFTSQLLFNDFHGKCNFQYTSMTLTCDKRVLPHISIALFVNCRLNIEHVWMSFQNPVHKSPNLFDSYAEFIISLIQSQSQANHILNIIETNRYLSQSQSLPQPAFALLFYFCYTIALCAWSLLKLTNPELGPVHFDALGSESYSLE